MSQEETRGGRRENSGRPSTWNMGKCKPIKVPEAIADQVMASAREIDKTEYAKEFGHHRKTSDEKIKEIKDLIALVNQDEPGYTARNSKKLIRELMEIVGYGARVENLK